MNDIRLIQLGDKHNLLISNLALRLSSIQNVYNFTFKDDIIIPDFARLSKSEKFIENILAQLILDYMHKNKYSEYPIAITDIPLPDEIISTSNEHLAIISTNDHESYCSYPLLKLLEYRIALFLLDNHIETTFHEDIRSCPNDYLDNRNDVNKGLEKGEFCLKCKRQIISSLEIGKITIFQMSAIQRILDCVSNRKICFVLMPFKQKFETPYSIIKDIIQCAGFDCIRADEIFEPRNIVNLIFEAINRAEIILADLTDRNPNVFYELGYAHALGKNTVLLTQKPDDVPFDLRQRQFIHYDLQQDIEGLFRQKLSVYFNKNS